MYNLKIMMDHHSNYSKLDENINSELVKLIHDNFDKMDDAEMKIVLMKCLTTKQVKRLLLEYEFKHYKPELVEKIELNEMKQLVAKTLKRYQSKAGGFELEDNEWTFYDYKTSKYDININEIVFENTVDILDKDSRELDTYLDCLGKRLSFAKNISIEFVYKRIHASRKTYHVLIWITDMDKVFDKL